MPILAAVALSVMAMTASPPTRAARNVVMLPFQNISGTDGAPEIVAAELTRRLEEGLPRRARRAGRRVPGGREDPLPGLAPLFRAREAPAALRGDRGRPRRRVRLRRQALSRRRPVGPHDRRGRACALVGGGGALGRRHEEGLRPRNPDLGRVARREDRRRSHPGPPRTGRHVAPRGGASQADRPRLAANLSLRGAGRRRKPRLHPSAREHVPGASGAPRRGRAARPAAGGFTGVPGRRGRRLSGGDVVCRVYGIRTGDPQELAKLGAKLGTTLFLKGTILRYADVLPEAAPRRRNSSCSFSSWTWPAEGCSGRRTSRAREPTTAVCSSWARSRMRSRSPTRSSPKSSAPERRPGRSPGRRALAPRRRPPHAHPGGRHELHGPISLDRENDHALASLGPASRFHGSPDQLRIRLIPREGQRPAGDGAGAPAGVRPAPRRPREVPGWRARDAPVPRPRHRPGSPDPGGLSPRPRRDPRDPVGRQGIRGPQDVRVLRQDRDPGKGGSDDRPD